jgi:hypothetical protein
MSTISHPASPNEAPQPSADPIWCGNCNTTDHLILDSIEPLKPPVDGLVDISYTCIECDTFYAHVAVFLDAASILNERGSTIGVLQFGGEYVHCGQPMRLAGSAHRSLHAPILTDDPGNDPARDLLDVYLKTKVLQCSCGFRMELPA